MNYGGHLAGGILTSTLVVGGSLFYSGMNFTIAGICGLTTLIFSLYPDLDVASKPSRYAFIIGIPLIIYLGYQRLYLEAILSLILIGLPKMFSHRGVVHTLKFAALVSLCWMYILKPFITIEYYYIGISTLVGYMTHLILDNHVKI